MLRSTIPDLIPARDPTYAKHVSARVTIPIFRTLWNIVRAPILALLLLCEPVVTFGCAALMVLIAAVAVVLKVSAIGPHFPFLGMLAFAAGCGLLVVLYHGLIALFLE